MTEQEQIKAIKQIIDERVETTLGQVQGRHDNVIKTVDTVIIARDIVKAGYGDVSEYKVEIERLKVKIERLEEETDEYISEKFVDTFEERQETYNYGFSMGYSKGLSKVKQAQIDVLNKAKERLKVVSRELGDEYDLCGVSAVCSCRCEIDELIKEVQDGEDKS